MRNKDIKLAGIIQGQEEIDAVNRVLRSEWHASGPECVGFQNAFATKVGCKYCVAVNSGSSANLLALQALKLRKKARVLTSACGFPATLNPILHLGHKPVFVDYNLCTLQAHMSEIEDVIRNKKIDAILLAHTLGSAFDLDRVVYLCKHFDIPLIEDCCEALGTKYDGRHVGTFGEVSTFSFYSSHHINGLGGGGAICTNDVDIYETCKSLRDWGKQNVREGNICTKMDTDVDGIKYDQQYTYDTIGYNMRLPDVNCAYLREQLKRLDGFVAERQVNYATLEAFLKYDKVPLYFMKNEPLTEPSPFGFPIVLNHNACGYRNNLVEYLERHGIHVRLFFAGNILRHKAYHKLYIKHRQQDFSTANYLMSNALFCGCWPGLNTKDMRYIADTIKEFFNEI